MIPRLGRAAALVALLGLALALGVGPEGVGPEGVVATASARTNALAPSAPVATASTLTASTLTASTRSSSSSSRASSGAGHGRRRPVRRVGFGPVATTPSKTATTATDPNAPVPVPDSSARLAHRRLSAHRVLAIAGALPKMRRERAKYPGSYGGAYLKGPAHWQVSYFSKPTKEIGQVLIDDATGRVLEQWTGFQVAWTMARGYSGAFGHRVNALYIWLPLSVLFVLPFLNRRRPFSLLHLDLLVLSLFSVSLAFFNHGRIYASVPLAYPPLLYLLVRMLIVARPGRAVRAAAGGRQDATPTTTTGSTPSGSTPSGPTPSGLWPSGPWPSTTLSGSTRSGPSPTRDPGPLHLLVPAPWLAVGVVFLIGFRVALNVVDSNVIDVGYAGVIGAHRVVHGQSLYGGWPSDNQRGDTYGPVNSLAYIPFVGAFGWSGHWDDLPAAHAASIVFDLLAVALMFLLGRRVRGPTLGLALAYAWVANPFTLFSLESNSNDALVAALILAALLLVKSAPARGALGALAALTKFAPLALAPMLATHGLDAASRRRRVGVLAVFTVAFAATVAVAAIPALAHSSLHTFYERTLVYQANRGSPFSIWGLYGGLRPAQVAVQLGAVLLALALAVLPRRSDLIGLAAAAGAAMIAVQLGIDHWFYLYIPWFFGLVMLALLGRFSEPGATEVAASAPARSRQLVAA